jgi:hypothetical protein
MNATMLGSAMRSILAATFAFWIVATSASAQVGISVTIAPPA